MKRLWVGICAVTLACAAGQVDARQCRKPGLDDRSHDARRSRDASYDACMRQEERLRQRRQEKRTARAPIDQGVNAPPPRRSVESLQGK